MIINKIINKIIRTIQLKLCNYLDAPLYFLNHGCIIPHPYGITLSVESIGADCVIYQNVTIGSSGSSSKELGSEGKPIIGNRVVIFSGSVISGHIKIGNNVIVAANSVVTKDIPDNYIVYGVNKIKPFDEHHKEILAYHMYHCRDIYRLVKGLSFKNGKMWINVDYNR